MDDIHGVSDIRNKVGLDGNKVDSQPLTDEYVPLSRNIFFAKDVAPRWASNHGPFYGNYADK